MGAPFSEGLPYLSRLEEIKAKERQAEREAIADIKLESVDEETICFINHARNEINAWLSSTSKVRPERQF